MGFTIAWARGDALHRSLFTQKFKKMGGGEGSVVCHILIFCIYELHRTSSLCIDITFT